MPNTFATRPVSRMLKRTKAPGEAEFQALFQILPGPAVLVDNTKEQVVLANSPFLQLTAYSLNEIINRDLRSLFNGLPSHSLSGEEIISVVLDRRSRPPQLVTLQVRALDGTGQWLALLVKPEDDGRKSILSSTDQTIQALVDLNRIQDGESLVKTLDNGLEIVRQLLGVSVVAIYQVEGTETVISKTAGAGEENILPETLLPEDLLRLTQTFVWQPGRRVQTELHRTARIQNLSYLASTPISQNGLLIIGDRTHEPSDQLAPVVEALGKQFSIMIEHYIRIIELRRQALENRRELSVLCSVGENAQEGILKLAPDMTVSELNPAAEWMLGYANWEVKGQPVENILIGPERLMPALEIAGQGIPTHNMGNVSLHRRNGQAFPAHIHIVPVQPEGETQAILIFFSDVSAHEEIRNRTQQLEQRAVLGEVTAVFAHEVRNPINNISTGLQLLTVKLPENDPNQENIARLLNDCQRLNHLMESVLNFSRQVEHKLEKVDIEILLRRILDRWRPRMAKVNVTSYFQMEPTTPPILGDPRSLEQVFTNLVSNAVEAMSDHGGTLAVRVASFTMIPERPQVEVTVSDSGPGIPDEVKERIFEPFVTTKSQGTGLGLAITKRIVTAHHGSISVNTFPGGTVFHVILSAYQGETE